MNGTCEMCGKHNADLRLFVCWEYIGYTCRTCIDQVTRDNLLRMRAATDHTEPSE